MAGGIGITPIYGMALRLAERGADVRLAYAVRRREDAAFARELAKRWATGFELYASAEGGRLDAGAFLCGLPARYAGGGVRSALADERCAAGLGRGRRGGVRSAFRDLRVGWGRASEPFRVQFSWRGETREIAVPETKSMLDALAEAGVEVAYDCLRGECGLCVLDVTGVCGEIDHRDVFLSDRQKAENKKFARACRAQRGSITIDSAYRAA